MFGAYQLAAATGVKLAGYLSAAVGGTAVTLNGTTEDAGKGQILLGLLDVAYGEGACSA